MRNHFLRASGVPSSGGSTFGGVTTNLTTHWDFGNSSSYSGSGSTVTDLSGNGNNGTLQNTSNISYSSDDGGHIILDPSSSSDYPYIVRSDTFKDIGTGNYTIEWWWKPYWTGVTNRIFTNQPNTTNPWPQHYAIFIANGKIRVTNWVVTDSTTGSGSWTYLDSSAVYTSSQYHSEYEHLVFSRIGTGNNNTKFYRNNSLVETFTGKLDYDDANNVADDNRAIGHDAASAFRGKLGIYRLYVGKGFTSSDVTTNWNLEKSRFGH